MSRRERHPPVVARAALRVSLPAGPVRDSILGDFAAEYRLRAESGSAAGAYLWYWRQALGLAARSAWGRVVSGDRYWASREQRLDPSLSARVRLDMLSQDVRFGVRQVTRRPGFAALVTLTLAIGIGGNVAIFSVLKGVVLRQLPYPEAGRLVAVWETPTKGRNYQPFSGLDYQDVRQRSETLEEFGVLNGRWFNVAEGAEPVRVRGASCTASLLRALGVPPAQGRLFADEEELAGNERVVLIGHSFWQRQFGGAADVVGREVIINREPHEIVGIMPEHFEFPTPYGGRDTSELWTPLVLTTDNESRGSHWLGGIARLADGVSVSQAGVELQGIAAQLSEAYPDTNGHTGIWVEPMMRRTLGGVALALVFLLIVVGLVLLIACANVASMLLARGTSRLPELAVRASMGAGRHRLMGQLLTESLVLSLLGGAGGVVLAYWGVGVLRGALPDSMPRVDGIAVDTTVLFFAAVITACAGLLFGTAPALFAARTDLVRVLKDGRSGAASGAYGRPLAMLVAAQFGIGLILVNVTAVLFASYVTLMRQDMNFATDNVVVAGVSLGGPTYAEPHQRRAFWDTALERTRALPGVEAAGLTNKLPLRGGSNSGVLVNDEVYDPTTQDNLVEFSFIADGYHEAMGISLLAGRTLEARDLEMVAVVAQEEGSTLELPIVINRAMAEEMWPDESALGKLVRPYSATEYFRGRVVGVVENTRQWGPERRALPEIFFPHTAEVWGPSSDRLLVVRTTGNTQALETALREVVLDVDDRIPVSGTYTMADVLREGTGGRRFSILLVSLFAGAALLLIVAGTYGTMSYTVSRRTHEIGVRVALGANGAGVLRLFIRYAARTLAPGIVFGMLGAISVAAVTRNMVYGISPLNPLYAALALIIMLLVSAVAIAIPVVRAMHVDPVEALRAE